MMHIGQIRDELRRRSNEEINDEQLINCGIYLANEGLIRIGGDPNFRGWVEAIILHPGIRYLETIDERSDTEVA